MLKVFTDMEFTHTFFSRMSLRAFSILCEMMKDAMSPDKITVHHSVPLEMRVVIALYKLSSCREYS